MNPFSKYCLFYCTIKSSSSFLYDIDSDSAFISGYLASSEICMKGIFSKLICCGAYEYFFAPPFTLLLIFTCEELSKAILVPDIFFKLVQLFNAMSYAGIIHTLCNSHYLIQLVISTVISYNSSRHDERRGCVFCHIMPASFLEIMFFCFLYLICRIFTKKVKFSANFLYESVCRFPLHG